MSEWKEYRVKEFAEIVGGGTPSTKNERYFGGGISWITPRDLTNHKEKYISKGDRSITKEGLNNSSAKLIPPNSILLTSRAPIGYLAISKNEVATNQGFKSLIVDSNLADYNFVYYLIKTNIERIKSLGSGTTFSEISASVVKNITFKLPSLPTQTAIAEILSSLDDKIELNNKINQELENLAQTLFKRWFVDFEFPNENGDPYKSSGGVMVESELGLIPEGWEVGKFGSLCSITNGFAFKSKDFKEIGDNRVIKIRNISNGIVDILNTQYVSNSTTENLSKKYEIIEGDILIAMTGAEVGKTGLVINSRKKLWLNQRVGKFEPKKDVFNVFIYNMFNVLKLSENVKDLAMGSAQPNISSKGIESIRCLLPTDKLIEEFSFNQINSFKLLLNNLHENQSLTNLRDTLLPKLISGELTIEELQQNT